MVRNLFAKLWADDRGFIVSTEMLFVTVILVIGLVVGLVTLRNALLAQFTSVSTAIVSLDGSYSISSVQSADSGTGGSSNGTNYVYTADPAVGTGAIVTAGGVDPAIGPGAYVPAGNIAP